MISFTYVRNALESFKDINMASKTFGIMLIPVLSFVLIFEIFIPKSEIIKQINDCPVLSHTGSWKLYIIYLSVAIAHIIISLMVILYLRNRFCYYYSHVKSNVLLKISVILLSFMLLLFILSNIFDTNLALLSNERILSILQKHQFYRVSFTRIIQTSLLEDITIFPIIPFTLILIGLLVIVLTCTNIGFDLAYVINNLKKKNVQNKRTEIETRIKEFNNYLYILSFVLLTSTIATMLYLQLPLTCIEKGAFFERFQNQSFSVGICWGIIFSLTMLTMCLYPFYIIQKKTETYIKENYILGNDEYVEWLKSLGNNYLIYNNFKLLLSVLSPIIVSTIPKFL